MVYTGKYDRYVHGLSNGRFIVGLRCCNGGVSTRNPPVPDSVIVWRVKPLAHALHATTFVRLAEIGVPTYANVNAAIKAARRVYPELEQAFPWRTDPARAA